MNPLKYAYLAIEAWFNVAFGSEWNPLYNMGRLAFFFFWVVFISGLYLFIFLTPVFPVRMPQLKQ